MNRKAFFGLAGATLAAVVAAIIGQFATVARPVPAGGELMFPGLSERINDAHVVTVTSKDGSVTVTRVSDGWVVRDKHDYPARFDKIKETLVALSELKTVESKTRNPTLYDRLRVEEPGAVEESLSRLITVSDDRAAELARIIAGKTKYGRGGLTPNMIYVRKPGDEQTWLAEGEIDATSDPITWVQQLVVDIPTERVQRVTISHPDGERFEFSKASLMANNFTVVDLPAGEDVKSYKLDTIAGIVSSLNLSDLKPIDAFDENSRVAGSTEYRTFDGLVLTMTSRQADDAVWFTLQAGIDEAIAGETPSERADSGEADRPSVASADDAISHLKSPAEVRAEVMAINARAGGWAYQLPDYNSKNLRAKLADVLENGG